MLIKKMTLQVLSLLIITTGIIGCAGPNRSKEYSMQQAEASVADFQTLSQEEVKFAFLANYYYSESKFRRSKIGIAESVFPDLATEARARRQANLNLNALERDVTGEFERRLGPELKKYAGRVFRARLQNKGSIDATMISPTANGLAIKTNVFPNPILQDKFRPFGIAPSRYSGILEAVGGPQSRQSIRYPSMAVTVRLPVSTNEYQKIVYETQKARRDSNQYTMEFMVDFSLDCAEYCEYKVLGTQIINYSLN